MSSSIDAQNASNNPDNASSSSTQDITAALNNVHLNENNDTSQTTTSSELQDPSDSRPLIIYTRKQILALSKSPLVKVPNGMPPFKAWYGEPEQTNPSNKKDSESSPSNVAARNARYRRDGDDGDAPSRPSFRSTLSQPSQMGNFKHQPLRGTDRDRETESSLRNLSDKYDRERGRIGTPSHSTLLRNRDRDSAPHLTTGRDSGKKRNGENHDDWRRGAEPPRNTRDEHQSRRDRDDRERPRSRARDSSRQRESPHSTRRDRDDRERGDRRERDRDDNRNHDFMRRDRDRDRFVDEDDNRRWRDDGKRDERLSQRRDKDHSRERTDDESWRDRDDGRGPKRGQRERRLGGGFTDSRDRDDKKEKEKEPAWMETYVPPPSSSGGILGGKGFGNEVDSIQAFKRDMKERELKAKGLLSDSADTPAPATTDDSQPKDAATASTSTAAPETQPLDEIQLFKLMMKQSKPEMPTDDRLSPSVSTGGPENGISGLARIRGARSTSGATVESTTTDIQLITTDTKTTVNPTQTELTISSPSVSVNAPTFNEPTDIVSAPMITQNVTEDLSTRIALPKPASAEVKPSVTPTTLTTPFDPPRQSRLLALGAQSSKSSLHSASLPPVVPAALPTQQQPVETVLWNGQLPTVTPAFPSQQGGLAKIDVAPVALRQQLDKTSGLVQGIDIASTSRLPVVRDSTQFAQFENQARLLDAARESPSFTGTPGLESSRASSVNHPAALDRANVFVAGSDNFHQVSEMRNGVPTPPLSTGFNASPLSPYDGQMNATGTSYASGKGSRMAKHFEKSRENQMQNIVRAQTVTYSGTPPIGRQDSPVFNGQAGGTAPEQRNISDLLAMLSNSAQAQAQRGHQQQILSSHGGMSQNLATNIPLHAQQQLQMHSGSLNPPRHEMLLDPEDRFVADGLVPGLRPAPAPRSRDNNNSGIFVSPDELQFMQRLPPQQQRNLEQLYGGPISPQVAGQGPGRAFPGIQQPPMRGGPSPISNFNPAQGPSQQRLPPGLANLGARPPPHETSQFLTGGGGVGGLGIPSQGMLSGLPQQHVNGPQSLNQFQNAGLGMGGNQPHLRGPPVGMGNMGGGGNALGAGLNGVGGLGGPAGMDFRGPFVPPQNQMMNLGGPGMGGGGGGMRGMQGFNAQNLHGLGQNVGGGPGLGLRQQGQGSAQQQGPQHHLQGPHILQQMMPGQMQQHGFQAGGQPNQADLMALLMGGAHRE